MKIKLLIVIVGMFCLLSFVNNSFAQGLPPDNGGAQGAAPAPVNPVQPLPPRPTPPLKSDGSKPIDNGETAGGEACVPGKDIMLNISIPFIGRCIKKDPAARQTSDERNNTTSGNVFPKLMGGMIRLLMTIIYIIGFLGILVGGFMIAASGASPELKTKGIDLIKLVISGLILVGLSGFILNFINPDFFSTASDIAQ